MELNDYNLKPYKNLNPYLDDTTERVVYEPENSNELALAGKEIDNIIGDELSKGYDKDVHYLNFAKQVLVSGADFAKNFFDTFLFAIKSNGKSMTQSDAFNDLAQQSKDNEEKYRDYEFYVCEFKRKVRKHTKISVPNNMRF